MGPTPTDGGEDALDPLAGIDAGVRRRPWRLLLGLSASENTDERGLHPSLVASYRLRVVAVGALVTAAALANLVVYLVLAGDDGPPTTGFLLVLFVGIVALGGVVLTPWNRVLVGRHALRVLYLWSVLGVVLVGAAVAVDGGGTSVLFVAFAVTTVFFAVAYPPRAQAALFTLTVVVYIAALAVTGWDVTLADFYVRLAGLAVVAYVASVLSGWLVAEMHDRARSTSSAEQRAGMLDTVARAARRISSLDAGHVLGGALAGAMDLGCLEAEVWLTEGDPPTLTLQRRVAVDGSRRHHLAATDQYEAARVSGATQVTELERDRVVSCLLHREGDAAGILLVRTQGADVTDSLVVECIELLAAQVSAGLDVARNVAERRGLEERLAHWAFHDSLTDLPNRVLFADRLELALARTARDGSKVAVLFLDLDDFKGINDELGHAAGDELLHTVAVRLHGCLRPNDTLARYGGDEFVVLVEQVDGADAATLVARRILEALTRPVLVAGRELMVRTSIGIALTGARPGADSDVLRRADIAMYEAKTAGGGRFVIAADPPSLVP